MKKFLSLLLVIATFAAMIIGVGAAKSNEVSTAVPIQIGKSFYVSTSEIAYWNPYFYKFTIPYTGKVTFDITAVCDQPREGSASYIYIGLCDMSEDEIKEYRLNIPVKQSKGERLTASISSVLEAGTYCFSLNHGLTKAYGGVYDCTISSSFQCSHTSTSTKTTVEPTCSSAGKEVITCNNCKETVSTDTISKLPHTPAEEWVKISEPTCSKDGEEQKSCTVCGGVADSRSIAKLPHTYGDWTTDTEPTCTKEGKRSRVCSVCGYKDTEGIDKLDHEFGDWEITTEPTCTVKGKETRECENCGKSESNTLDMLEHSFSDYETITEATCTKDGKEQRECSTCGKKETKTVEMLEHSYGKWEVYTRATCTSTGTERRYCKFCNKYEARTLEKTEHDYDDYKVVREPTCTQKGEERGYCNGCGKTVTDDIPMLDHNYGDWTVVTEATCAKAGKQTAICKDCGKATTKTISKIDHTFGEWETVTEPTCTKEGKQTHSCTACGKTDSEALEKIEHTVDEWTITREATETRKGTRKGKCTVCGNTVTEDYEKYPGRSGFKKSRNCGSKFSDVGKDKWFHEYVQTAYEYELANGTSDTKFSPDNKFTVAQALTAAANIHSAYYDYEIGKANDGEMWYVPYVNYCIENGIIEEGQFGDYNKNIKRGEMAEVFAAVLPAEEYESVRGGAPTDMKSGMKSYDAVTKLYRAGIVSGDAGKGTYRPDDEIVRSEACVIFTRIAVETYRAK